MNLLEREVLELAPRAWVQKHWGEFAYQRKLKSDMTSVKQLAWGLAFDASVVRRSVRAK